MRSPPIYAVKVLEALKAVGLRATAGVGAEKIGAKIREAKLQKIPYLLVVGEQEAAAETVAVRSRTAGDQGAIPLAEFITRAAAEVTARSANAAAASPA